MTTIPRYSRGEEIANTITHGFGALLSLGGFVVLTVFAARHGNVWHVVSCAIFGTTLIFLYTASTLYHAMEGPRLKPFLRILDHTAILLLIAGTYTPFTLGSLRGPWGWSLFAIVWSLALVGIILEATRLRRFRAGLITLYLFMGWVGIAAVKPLLAAIDSGGLQLLLAGGLAYTGGVAFYLWRGLPYHHAIWHLFVLAGSTLHYFAVLFYVIPMTGPLH
jgi:hemolysin III